MNSSPDRPPQDDVILGAGLNVGRVRVLAVRVPVMTSSKMALSFAPSGACQDGLSVEGIVLVRIVLVHCSGRINTWGQR